MYAFKEQLYAWSRQPGIAFLTDILLATNSQWWPNFYGKARGHQAVSQDHGNLTARDLPGLRWGPGLAPGVSGGVVHDIAGRSLGWTAAWGTSKVWWFWLSCPAARYRWALATQLRLLVTCGRTHCFVQQSCHRYAFDDRSKHEHEAGGFFRMTWMPSALLKRHEHV